MAADGTDRERVGKKDHADSDERLRRDGRSGFLRPWFPSLNANLLAQKMKQSLK